MDLASKNLHRDAAVDSIVPSHLASHRQDCPDEEPASVVDAIGDAPAQERNLWLDNTADFLCRGKERDGSRLLDKTPTSRQEMVGSAVAGRSGFEQSLLMRSITV